MAEGEKGAGGGTGGGDWREALPEPLRADPALKDFKDPGALATSYLETKKLVGSSLRPPGPEASAEARKEFADKLLATVPGLVYLPSDEKARAPVEETVWATLGRPKEAKEYAPPSGVELPAEALELLRAEAAEEGLTRRQFEARAKRAALALEGRGKAAQEMRATLKRELGAAYDERVGLAASAAEKLGFPEPLVKALKAGEVDMATFNALSAVAKGFGQRPEIGGQEGGTSSGKPTPAEAQRRQAEIRAHPGWRDSNHPEHKFLIQRMAELAPLAYPDA